MGILETIENVFRWIFLDKESNTWKEYCTAKGLIEAPKEEVKEPISLEKTVEQVKKSGAAYSPVVMNDDEFECYAKKQAEWEARNLEECKHIICNYNYDCDEARTAVNDLLYNNRDTWYIVTSGLNGRGNIIAQSLKQLTHKEWEYLGEVESNIYGWKVNYEKTLRSVNLEKDL
jgi:hypothetical protein